MTERAGGGAAEVLRLFDMKAATWSAKYAAGGRLAGRRARLAAAVQDRPVPGGRVLDLGCGTGDLARHLARAGLCVTGCDIAAQMLRQAGQADRKGRVEWIRLDPAWRRLPFVDGTFAAVVASSVLEYVDDPVLVLRECARVLQPGGTLICTVPDLRHPVRWLEYLLAVAARLPAAQALGSREPRVASYFTYLRISRQRHSSRWWDSAGQRAGMHRLASSSGQPGRATLRVLAFQKPSASSSVA